MSDGFAAANCVSVADQFREKNEAIKTLRTALLNLMMQATRRGVAADLEPFMEKAAAAMDATQPPKEKI